MRAGCRLSFWFLALVLGSAPLGCKNNDLLENELRSKDNQYRDALEELGRAEHRSAAQQREIEALRRGAKVTPEQAAQTFGLKRIALGRGTGGVDLDNLPGDEALQIILEPRDSDDHIIKAPGTLHILALEITPQGTKIPISSWTIDPNKLRQSWKQGLLSTGYNGVLRWKYFPQFENVRIVARLVTPDGRIFETDKDIKVHLVPGAPHRPDGPPDCPIPPPEVIDPFALPAAHTGPGAPNTTSSNWQPAPLENVVQLGQPVPILPPSPGPGE
jgi:hypothetical protein